VTEKQRIAKHADTIDPADLAGEILWKLRLVSRIRRQMAAPEPSGMISSAQARDGSSEMVEARWDALRTGRVA
jgi:hypothetical protein